MKRQRPEDDLQMQACAFLARALPEDAVWLHIPNGGKRSKAEAGRFKAMGVKAGAPDLAIFLPLSSFPEAIWIELKRPGTAHRPSAVTDDQRGMHQALRNLGHYVYVVDNLDDIERALRLSGVPLRATLGRMGHDRRDTEAPRPPAQG